MDKRSDKRHVVPGPRVVSALETLPAEESAGLHPCTSDQLPVQTGEFTKLPVQTLAGAAECPFASVIHLMSTTILPGEEHERTTNRIRVQ